MVTWDEVALRHGTDKASSYHGYMEHYEAFVGPRTVRTVLELGVLYGSSLRAWADIFPHARVIGVDVNVPGSMDFAPNVEVIFADVTDPAAMAPVIERGPFDFIVDDASHDVDDIAKSFAILRSHLAPGGTYAVEDTRFGPPHPSKDPAPVADVFALYASDTGFVRVDVVRSAQMFGNYHWQALVLGRAE